MRVQTFFEHRVYKHAAVDVAGIHLARAADVCNEDLVRVVKAFEPLVEQGLRAAVGVGL